MNNENQSVVFFLDKVEYAVDIANVQEIIRLPKITGMPGTPDDVLGIVNLRGSIIPIVDLKKRLMQIPSEFGDETRVLVVENKSRKVGLIVDEVSEVFNIPAETVAEANSITTGINTHYITGVANFNDRLLILLNIGSILN